MVSTARASVVSNRSWTRPSRGACAAPGTEAARQSRAVQNRVSRSTGPRFIKALSGGGAEGAHRSDAPGLRTVASSASPLETRVHPDTSCCESFPPAPEGPMLDPVRRDARFALRGLLRSPAFTLIAIASIGVGVGATTAIVTLANTLLLKPPPGIGSPERLVTVGRTQDGRGFDNFSYPNYLDYQASTRTLLGLAAMRVDPEPLSLAGPAGGEAIQGGLVTGNFFDVLQAGPSAGRFFHADEDRPGGTSAVVVLNHRFWRTRFAADPAVVGRKIVLNGAPFTVVGVAAERFQGPFVMAPDLWIPLRASSVLGRPEDLFTSRQAVWLMGIGRLARDASRDAVQAELGAVAARLAQEYPDANAGKGIRVMPVSLFPGDVGSMVGAFMAMLLGVAGLVLLIASTNVAGMLLARAAARQREIAVRLALGASRGQLVRQLATESVILFLAAGAAGVALSHWLVRGLMALVPALPGRPS